MAANTPNLLWSQRKDTVLLKIDIPDVKNHKLTFDDSGKVEFEGESNGKKYKADFVLYGGIVQKDCKAAVRPRQIELLLKKAESKWWPRCLKQEGKAHFLKVDWGTWKDEDDAGDSELPDFGGMSGMPGMGGFGGMGGMDMEQMMAGMGGAGGAGGMPPLDDEEEPPKQEGEAKKEEEKKA